MSPSRSASPARARPFHGFAIGIVACAAALVFAGSRGADFVLDDLEIVRDNPRLAPSAPIAALFTTDYWAHVPAGDHGLFRPLTLATFAVQRRLGAESAAPYRFVNVLLHAAVAALLFHLTRRLARDDGAAFLAALLFAVHPVHVEAVVGLVGRAEILALFFLLGAIEAYRHAAGRRAPLAIAACACAAFGASASKEWGVVAPAAILWTDAAFPSLRRIVRRGRPDPRAFGAFTGALFAVGVYLVLRAGVVGPRGVHEAFADAGTGPRLLTAVRTFGENMALLSAPLRLVADADAIGTPLARGFGDPGVIGGAAALLFVALLLAATWRRRPLVAWGLGLFLVTLLPVSNVFFAVGVVKADRVLYGPSAGFLVAVGAGLSLLCAKPAARAFGIALAATALLLATIRTLSRVPDWKDNCTLARATLRDAPDSAIFGVIQARCLLDAERIEEARDATRHVLEKRPDFVPALVVAGFVERVAGREDEAAAVLDRALALEPEHRVALDNAAWLHLRAGRFDRARDLYERWRRLEPNDPGPIAGLVAALAQNGELESAARVADEGLRRFPSDANLRTNAEIVRRLHAAVSPAAPEPAPAPSR